MKFLRQSTAAIVVCGPFLNKSDGLTPLTSLTDQSAACAIEQNGTDAGAVTLTSWTHNAQGQYAVGLSTTHTNTLGRFRIAFSSAGTYLPIWEDFSVLSQAVYDSLFGTSALASPTNITAGTITTVTNLTNAPTAGDLTTAMKTSLNAATPVVTVSDKTGFSLSSAGIQAVWDNLLSATYAVGSLGAKLKAWTLGTDNKALLSTDAQTGVVLPRVTLTDTLTTYTNNTPQTGDSFARIGANGAGLTSVVAASVTATVSLAANDETTLARLYAMTNTTPAFISAAFPTPSALTGNDIDSTFVTKIQAGLSTGGGGGTTVLYGEGVYPVYPYTVFDQDGTTPLPGVAVYGSANADGSHPTQVKITDSLGQVKYKFADGTVYFWRFRADRLFTNPDTEQIGDS